MEADAGNGQAALAAINEIQRLKDEQKPGYARVAEEKIEFERGTIEFWYRDYDDALQNMLQVTAKASDLDLNTGVLAWLRLGQIYDLKGNRPAALNAYKEAIAFAPSSIQAKESRHYLSSPYRGQPSI